MPDVDSGLKSKPKRMRLGLIGLLQYANANNFHATFVLNARCVSVSFAVCPTTTTSAAPKSSAARVRFNIFISTRGHHWTQIMRCVCHLDVGAIFSSASYVLTENARYVSFIFEFSVTASAV